MNDISPSHDQRALWFWEQQLQGELPVLDLPLDHNRRAVPTWSAGSVHRRLPARGLRAIAERHGVAVETVVLAGYYVLLQRYASQDEVVIGLEASRRDATSRDVAGYLPIRVNLAARPTFAELVAEVGRLVASARAHADYPVHALIEKQRDHRDPDHSPTFQAVFALPARDAAAAGGARFDLALGVIPASELDIVLSYDAGLFARETAERIASAFAFLLEGVAAGPERRVTDLPMLTPEERRRVVGEWNATAREFPRDRLLHDYVVDHARGLPDALAVVFEGRTLTYRELDHKANALAAQLQALGVTADSPVGLYLERSPELIVSILAVLKAGGAYLPIDPTYPSDRLAFMLEDARVGVVISLAAHFDFLRSKYRAATLLDAAAFVDAPGTPEPPDCPVRPSNLAYIIYTSGSTGKPKGAMLPHSALSNFFSWVMRTYDVGPGDRCLHYISPSFDVSVWEIFCGLCSGATLVIGRRQDPTSLARLIRDQRITFAAFLPSILESLMAEDAFRTCTSLRYVTTGAESMSVALQDAYLALGHGELYSTGGTTETAVASTHWKCVRGTHRVVPYGRPIDNTTIYLLDDNFDPVPIGVRGEMYIGGAGCGRGFANRPDVTAYRFVPDPFGDTPGARMYRTGDFARWLPDGALEFLGRLDAQVKVRGFRIELGEIGGVLAQHPAVRDSIVLARGDSGRDRRLVGYVVGNAGRPDPRELRAWLKTRLPEYMVPSAIVVLDAMPRLPNGKLDRNALPAPGSSAEYVAPRSDDEHQVAAIWQQLLKLERVGTHDDFFELGGHSLMATQVLSRLRDRFGVELPLRAVFEAPTAAGLAAVIAQARGTARTPAPPIEPVRRDRELALSFAQQRLWFLDQYEAGPLYNEPVVMRLRGALDAGALERGVNAVIARHEALRTTFAVSGGRPHQVVHAALQLDIPQIDLTGVEPATREAEARRLAVAEARRPFDLERGPVLRLALFELAPDEHWLLLVMHHIVGDDWSLTIFWNELAGCYRAFAAGSSPALPPLAVQYADFAAWQRRWLSGDELARQLGYWKTQLAGIPSLIDLPTDRPRPPAASHRGAARSFELGAALAARLGGLSRRLSATPFMVLLAAFQTLLHRYTREDQVVTGTVVANRNRAQTEELIGFFVNTVVCRTDFSGAPTFRELVGRVREVALGAYDHQDVPFEQIVEQLHPRRSPGYTPLFQVMFVLQNAPQARTLPGLEQSPVDLEIGISKFDLTLFLEERPGGAGLRGRFEYATDLFDDATIARMIGHLERLLDAAAGDPELAIAELPLIGDAERRQLAEWTTTARAYPASSTVHELFEQRVDRTPEAIAIELEGARLTYAELDRRANQLAHRLASLGVGPDVLVGICVERSLEMVVALLGILKAGGAYVPLDPGYPAERLAFMMEDARTPVLVTQRSLAGKLPAHRARVVELDDGALAGESPARRTSGATAEHLAYVDFTSGSTGRPKGVCVPHRAVARLVLNTNYIEIRPNDVFLQLSPLAFDASTFELWGPLLNGARLVILSPHTPSLEELGRVIVDRGISVLWLTAPLFHQMVDHRLGDLARLRVVLAGGDVLSVPHVERAVEQLGCTVINGYGPTENTTFTCCYPVPRRLPARASLSIGRPIANTAVYVLDSAGQPAPIGVPGELHAGGDGLARGYLHRPELTAEKFVPNRFGPGRLYRTGDLVRWLADGTLEFLGRVDQQVKIRGFRIELGEIEAMLAQDAAVREAVVVVHEAAPGDKQLVAYVVGSAGPPAASELRSRLATRLPGYMIPSAFVALDALPLTPNGKLDRKALAQHEPSRQRRSEPVAPRTPTEREVAHIFEQLLRLPSVGARDGFFELGGHSLLATQVISRVREAFRVELPLRSLFEAATVESLAAAIDARSSTASAPPAPPIARVRRDGELELSFAQQRLWFLDQLEPGSPFYNVAQVVRLRGPLDVAVLERSLQAIIARHEALRTTFAMRDGNVRQVIAPELALRVAAIDLRHIAPAQRDAEARRLAIEEARRPFDLARGPLARAGVLRCGDAEHWLVIGFHHIISDGWSIEVFWRELATIYEAVAAGRAPELPPLAIQYADFSAWQRRWLSGPALDDQLRYWRQQLAGCPGQLELPTDRPRPPVMTYRGALCTVEIPAAVANALQALARREAATLFMTLLAAFQALLCRHSGQTDILVGSPVASRGRAELEGLIGLFVNTVVLRGDLSGDPSFRALLARVREAALGAYAHQDIPFEKLVEELRPERSLAYSPLFQVMFDLTTEADRAAIAGLASSIVEIDGGIAKFDLTLSMEERRGGLRATFEYATDLYDEATIARMADHLQRLLAAIAADPDRPISRLPILGDAERRQVVVELNDTARSYPRAGRIFERFERRAAATPNRTAVVFEDRSVSYAELDARANQLARHLQALGVGAEVLVGVAMERSIELVVALLAILKAGGAYVPFDPDYPRERLEYMIGDARPRVVLVQDRLRHALPLGDAPVLAVDAAWPEIARHATAPLGATVGPDNLVYVIYTSGSTGRPKGAMNTHAGIENHFAWMTEAIGFGPDDAFLQKTPYSFDASTYELFLPLAIGARLVLARPGGQLDPAYMADMVRRHGITIIQFVPSMLGVFLELDDLAGCASLRRVIVGGEALSHGVAMRCRERLTAELHNHYGQTEASDDASHWKCGSDEPPVLPIGRPISNVQVYVLDPHLEPVPVGVLGEIYVAGAGLARGYLDRPALTAERFLPDPFARTPGGRLYRTGDLGCVRGDGVLEYVGRVDHQVKLRGFRIELGEIEAELALHPAVHEVVVEVREVARVGKQLVAYVVGDAGAAELRARLKRRLPDYMVPSAFVRLDELPLSPNGKLDRKALPAPTFDAGAEHAAPRTRSELAVARIFGELLGLASIGSQADFFALGGHSLMAVRLFAAIEARLGVALPIATVFRAPTVEALAREIDHRPATAPSPLVALRPHGARTPLVCVHPIGGTVFCYQPLIARLAADRPCYGLEAIGLDGEAEPAASVAEMAGAYARALLDARSSGPFHLMGWSFGGVVALELAHLLARAGHHVVSTTLIDSFAPSGAAGPRLGPGGVLGLFAQDLGLAVSDDELRGLAPDAALARVADLAHAAGLLPAHLGADHLARRVRVITANLSADERHVPRSAAGRVVLIRARDRNGLDPADGWRAHLGDLTVVDAPGDHHSMFAPPNVGELARLLDDVIAAS